MYISAVLNAVHDTLVNSALSSIVKSKDMIISHDSSPVHPSIGQTFILVHPVERLNPSDKELVYEDLMMFGVTVGKHGRDIPKDRLPEWLYSSTSNNVSIEVLRDLVILLVLTNNSNIYNNIYTSINSTIGTLVQELQDLLSNKYSLVNKIKYLSTDASPVLRYPEYFESAQKIEDEPRPAGYTFTTVFSAPKLMVATTC